MIRIYNISTKNPCHRDDQVVDKVNYMQLNVKGNCSNKYLMNIF